MSFQHRFLKEKTRVGDHLYFNIKELKLVKFKNGAFLSDTNVRKNLHNGMHNETPLTNGGKAN